MSGDQTGDEYDLASVMGDAGGDDPDGGVPYGGLLSEFAEGVCARDMELAAAKRAQVVAAMGEPAMVDAAAVIAAFNAYPRVADATGIPLEDAKREMTAPLRQALNLDALDTSEASLGA